MAGALLAGRTGGRAASFGFAGRAAVFGAAAPDAVPARGFAAGLDACRDVCSLGRADRVLGKGRAAGSVAGTGRGAVSVAGTGLAGARASGEMKSRPPASWL